MDTLLTTRRPVPAGCPLSKTEYEVLIACAQGLSQKQVATLRGRAETTIRTQLHDAYGKLGVGKLSHALIVCGRHGWLYYGHERRATARQELSFFTTAYLEEFDRWIASRWTDDVARRGMRLALGGMLNRRQLSGEGQTADDAHGAMYDLLTFWV